MNTYSYLIICFLLVGFTHINLFATDTLVTKTITVEANRTYSAASDETFRSQDLTLLPRYSTQDLLRVVPGLMIAQHAGGGKAEQIFLRGFDADHGTDINISVDGAPVNMVSHGHGQGYADLHFVIPELVERIDVVKGPYFAQYGDLTTAGAVTLHLADTLRNNIAKVEAGLFGMFRGLGLASTKLGSTSVYGGAEFTSSEGYFEIPQGLKRVNLIAKTFTPFSETTSLSASLTGFTSDWNASGQIPQRAVTAGVITRFGSIDPTEGGNTSRTTFQLALAETGPDAVNIKASVTDYKFQLFSNFTFFANDSVNGDMIEQTDNRQVYSIHGSKTFSATIDSTVLLTQLGANVRHDNIHAALYNSIARNRTSTVRDNNILQTNMGVFAQQTLFIHKLSVVLGIRGDYFAFNVSDIAKQSDAPNGTSYKFVVSPKANLVYAFNESTSLFLNSGFGFHSNDARVAVATPNATTVPRAFGSEIGTRWSNQTFAVSAAAWMLDLESEFVWIGDEGTTEESGATRRIGIDLEARVQLADWLTFGGNGTVSRGRFTQAIEGENLIPLAPSFTLTSFAVATFNGISTAVRLRHVGSRPANETNTVLADGYSIFDVTASIPLNSSFELNLQAENLLNATWREAQFDTQSRLLNEPTSISEIHYTPGTPFTLRLGVAARF